MGNANEACCASDEVIGDRAFGSEPLRVAALGRAVLDGVDVRDLPQALALFTRACDGGEPPGCYGLGQMLRDGDGPARDLARAADLSATGDLLRAARSADLGALTMVTVSAPEVELDATAFGGGEPPSESAPLPALPPFLVSDASIRVVTETDHSSERPTPRGAVQTISVLDPGVTEHPVAV